ncbi:MAG: hypothetical protein R3B48_15230 [Kofleriaceae bacterium]
MTAKQPLLSEVALRGLELAPSQVWGGVRLVPLLRREIRDDLRLTKRSYDEAVTVVSRDGELLEPGVKYISYVPHALVMSWSEDGSPVAALGAQLQARDGKTFGGGLGGVRIAHRMVRREDRNRLRFLPLHLAMEGFLAAHFGGPQIAWTEYSQQAISRGLDPRSESSVPGWYLAGLDDALRVFEIHERQVGVLVFISEALASVFVVPHPEDYVALHRSLLEDFYGELLFQYGLHAVAGAMESGIDASRVSSLAELRREASALRTDWNEVKLAMASGVIGKPVRAERLYRAGPFQLQRFATNMDPAEENHLGEAILRDTGELEYLKTFRLSAAQTRRAYLLNRLAEHHWNLDATAASFKQSKDELIRRLDKAGFGYLIKDHVLQAARRRR